LNSTIEHVATCRKKLSIEVPLDDVAREWKGVVTEFQKFAQIPGFRVGKAPLAIIERRFEKEISEEVQKKLIPQSFREAVAKEKLEVVSMPDIGEVKFSRSEPLRYQATVDVAPEFTVPTYKGLKVKKPKVEVKDEDVENGLKILTEQQAKFVEVKDRPLAFGDFAVISYSGVCEGKPIVQLVPSAGALSENKNFWLLMAKDSFLPGFCEPLLGARVHDKKQALVDFPGDFRIKDLAGRKATYFVEILDIREKQLPSLDDALASGHGASNIAELREKIRQNLTKGRERQADEKVRSQIVEQLLKTTTFDVPETLIAGETRSVVTDIIRENQLRGVGEDHIREKSKEIFDFASQSAKDRVRTSFILTRIAKAEKVEVKEEELSNVVREAAQQSGKSVEAISRQMRESGEWESVRERILVGHTLDLLVSHAIVEAE